MIALLRESAGPYPPIVSVIFSGLTILQSPIVSLTFPALQLPKNSAQIFFAIRQHQRFAEVESDVIGVDEALSGTTNDIEPIGGKIGIAESEQSLNMAGEFSIGHAVVRHRKSSLMASGVKVHTFGVVVQTCTFSAFCGRCFRIQVAGSARLLSGFILHESRATELAPGQRSVAALTLPVM